MSVEVGCDVRVNGIEPAAIHSEMLFAGLSNNRDRVAQLGSYHPTGSIGAPEDVASLAFWLGDSAPSYLHGEMIRLDGGISSRLHDPE
jgi:NAD(P)-dependent dehydrogenase (short-subunit alcohol dehydrogenase family)